MTRQVLAGFRVGEVRALPPTQGACRAQRELETWHRCYAQESSFLHEERRNFCEAFIFNASAAARLIEAHSPSESLVELWMPLVLSLNSLEYLAVIQDFDHLDPEQGGGGKWHDIKMGLTQTCLGLLLRILWAVLPRRADTWEEWQVGLHGHDWKQQFVIDSPIWRERLMIPPTEFPGLCRKRFPVLVPLPLPCSGKC